MVNCDICANQNSETCRQCRFGDFFERTEVSDKVSVVFRPDSVMSWGTSEFCGHCGYPCNYASCYRQFYCVKCGGLNIRTIDDFED